jgi:hypothetical protein
VTRQPRKISEKNPIKLVDNGLAHPLGSEDRGVVVGQGRENGEGTKINEDVWSEFILVADYLYRKNQDAEIADVFEWFRRNDLDGEEYSPSLLKRVTREVETECGPF